MPPIKAASHTEWHYRSDVDGLRAIAIMAVVLFHAKLPVLAGGYLGVDVFFVISGYLIGGIIYRHVATQRFGFMQFYARRAKRIFPALFLVTITTWLLGLILLSPRELELAAASGTAAIFGMSNIFFWITTDYFSEAARFKPLLMTWSLGVEEQFYLVFPWLILLLRSKAPRSLFATIAVLTGCSLALSLFLAGRDPTAAFYLLPSRAWELGVGTLLAIGQEDGLFPRPRPRGLFVDIAGIVGLAAVGVALTITNETRMPPGTPALLPVFGTALLIWAEPGTINRKLLASRPAVGIGLISYSWYLWHWPLMSMTAIITVGEPSSRTMFGIAFLSLLLAWGTWYLVEQPFRHSQRPPAPLLARYIAAMAIVAGVGTTLAILHGLPNRVPASIVALEYEQTHGRTNCFAKEGQGLAKMTADCQLMRSTTVALVGDSHAHALAEALRTAVTARGLGFVEFTKASCPMLAATTRWVSERPGHAIECSHVSAALLARLVNDRRIRVVVLAANWPGPLLAPNQAEAYATDVGTVAADKAGQIALMTQGIRTTIGVLSAAGKHVILVGDSPTFDFDPARAIKGLQMPTRYWLSKRLSDVDLRHDRAGEGAGSAIQQQVRTAVGSSTTLGSAAFVDIAASLCNPAGCLTRRGPHPLFIDNNHLSASGAAYAIQGIVALLPRGVSKSGPDQGSG